MADNTLIEQNAITLAKELAWFERVLQERFRIYFQQETEIQSIYDIPAPSLEGGSSLYAQIVGHYPMSIPERLTVLLALIPHLKPQMLDLFFTKNSLYDRGYTEFGGIIGQQHGGFLPTGETALFLLAGDDMLMRMQLMHQFEDQHYFYRHNILRLTGTKPGEPFLSSPISISQEYLAYFTTGDNYKPTYSASFPAKRLHTDLGWDDLVLAPEILSEIREIMAWIEHHQTILHDWKMSDKIKPGYKALFYGPPGTGKTMTASLMGQSTGHEVYRIDLSQIVSKYIGETEKNLASVFDRAEHNKWILFFDEADALFGKRTSTKDAKDRYANQEIAYLLQRIEVFPGIVILATNLKGNIDEAFARRFQSMIYFPMPDAQQRLRLWQNAFDSGLTLAENVDLVKIAQDYELAGGAIINILRYCALTAVQRGTNEVNLKDILQGIRREMRKEGKLTA